MTDKPSLRTEMKVLRAEAAARAPDAGIEMAANFPMKLYDRYGPVVSGYLPINDEIDPIPLMQLLAGKGAELCLPRIEEDDTMTFRRWQDGERLNKGKFGLREPSDDAEIINPTMLLVPLLAFDDKGMRLGYGKGHYDKVLAGLRAKGRVFACALAFQAQKLEIVPSEPHDEAMDWAVTETGNTPLFMMQAMRQLRDQPDSPDVT